MKASHGTTPIPLPGIVDDPKWIGRLSRDIRKSIAALRDRKVIVHGNSARLGGGGAAPPPLIIVGGSDVGFYKITPGYVNQEMPTLATVALDAEIAPEHEVAADTWFWIKVVATYGSTDTYAVTIQTTTTSDPPTGAEITETGFTSYRLIGMVDYTASPEGWAIKNHTNGGNVGVEGFGSVIFWWLA